MATATKPATRAPARSRRSTSSQRAAAPRSRKAPPREPTELELFEAFASHLPLEGGRPLRLEPFQARMLTDYFSGARETLILIPKKNGKTTLLAALALFHLVVTADAECVIAASSRDQATILFDQASGFVRRSEWLQQRVVVKRGFREIRSLVDAGRIRVLASDADTADGVIPTLALVDELHRHKSAELYGVFRDGLGPRDGRMLTISTAGDDETGPLGQMREAAHKLPSERDGMYRYARSDDGAFVLHEWALEDTDDRDDMKVVKQANPASWQTVEELRVRHDSASMTPWAWARFACGVWLQGEGTAIQPHEWDALQRNVRLAKRPVVTVGMDLGWKYDTTALVPIHWKNPETRVLLPPIILTPPGDGTLLDDRLIVRALLELRDRYTIERIVYDPNAGGQQLVQSLQREHGFTFVEHSQDSSPISLADARFLEAVRRKVLVHNGDRELRAHVLTAVERPLGGEKFKFDRPKGGARRPIDALRAASMAHSVLVAEHETPKRSRELLTF
jgi:phage terminase large subunit-like protein